MLQEHKKEFLVNIGFAVTVGALIYVVFKFMFSFFLPFIIAFLIAYAVQKPSVFFASKTPLKREICAVILSVLIFTVLIAGVIFLGYFSVTKAKDLFSNINGVLGEFSNMISAVQMKLSGFLNSISPEIASSTENFTSNFIEDIAGRITSFFSYFAGNIVKKAPSFLFSATVTLVATCYIAKDFRVLKNFYRNLFGERVYSKTVRIKTIISQSVFKIGKGYLLLMLLTFLELSIGFYILGVGYAVVLALLVSLVDLLPVLGAGTVLIPWGIVDVLLHNPRGFGILILYVAVTIIRNFAEPKVIGKQIGINPLFTLLSMFAGLRLLGFWGLILFPVSLIVIIEYYSQSV